MKGKTIAALCLCLVALIGANAATITVTTVDNGSGSEDGALSFDEALRAAADGDTIQFNIPGPGPHYIATPIGGYPLITAHNLTIDGYSQPGAMANTNSILGGNNAQIRIVLDSTGDDSLPIDPRDPFYIARRSTRILVSDYDDTENAMLGVLGADNFSVRGLSFIARRTAGTADDPKIYGVALINVATNARVQGCWFGLAPGGSSMADVKPVASAVTAFRYRVGGDVFSAGCIVGTDGDGVNDRAEFNVIVGSRIALALELPGARISGNYVNVFPNGLSFVDIDQSYALWAAAFIAGGSNPAEVSIENFENGRFTDGSVIGTNGDGLSDADERNVFGHVVYLHLGEFYRGARNLVCAGNYFGVGVDGVTPAPVSTNIAPDFFLASGIAQIRIGSNGDGISDDLEGNLIVNLPGRRFVKTTVAATPVVSSRNRLVNCNVSAVPFGDGENSVYAAYYGPFLSNALLGIAPVVTSWVGGDLKGAFAPPSAAYPYVTVSVYVCDAYGLVKTNFWPNAMTHPGRHLLSFADNGPEDLDLELNSFSVDVSGFGVPADAYLAVAASYSRSPISSGATEGVTSPMSNPISREPKMQLRLLNSGISEISWIAPPGAYGVEISDNLSDPGSWFPIGVGTYNLGRFISTVPTDYGSARVFFRVVVP